MVAVNDVAHNGDNVTVTTGDDVAVVGDEVTLMSDEVT